MASEPTVQTNDPQVKPLAVFSDQKYRNKRSSLFWLGVVLLFLLGVLAYWGYLQFLPRVKAFGPGILWINVKYFIVLFPIVLVLSLWLVIGNWPQKKQTIKVFADKILWMRGNKAAALDWKDIERIYLDFSQSGFLGIKKKPRQILKLTASGFAGMVIDGRFEKFYELVNLVRSFTFPILFEKAQSELNQFGKVGFGTAEIQAAKGLCLQGKIFPFEKVKEFSIKDGWFRLRVENGSIVKEPARRLYNLDVLMKLLEELARAGV
ncbi:MAG: DUF6585 family protein [Anaerolineaceae bacterium]